jgi:hypothetical protein
MPTTAPVQSEPERRCCWEEARTGGRPPLQCEQPAAPGRPWCTQRTMRFALRKDRRGRRRFGELVSFSGSLRSPQAAR